jgi:hypothetical protein
VVVVVLEFNVLVSGGGIVWEKWVNPTFLHIWLIPVTVRDKKYEE